MHTTSAWWQVEPGALEAAFPSRMEALDGFLGAAYAMHHVAALRYDGRAPRPWSCGRRRRREWFATVGPNGRGQLRTADGGELAPDAVGRFRPAVFLYDNYPGGCGSFRAAVRPARRDCRGGGCVGVGLRLPLRLSGLRGRSSLGRGARLRAQAAALRVLALLSDDAWNRAVDGAPTGTAHVQTCRSGLQAAILRRAVDALLPARRMPGPCRSGLQAAMKSQDAVGAASRPAILRRAVDGAPTGTGACPNWCKRPPAAIGRRRRCGEPACCVTA